LWKTVEKVSETQISMAQAERVDFVKMQPGSMIESSMVTDAGAA
jgi:hypothetical protein